MAPDGVHALPPIRTAGEGKRNAEPFTYLPVVGAPPLRFQEAMPPPDLVTRPPAAAPPTPALTRTESSVALANAAAARSTSITETEPTPVAAPVVAEKPANKETPPPPQKSAPPILRDDARPQVRPEDFLPYFQIPGAAHHPSDVTVIVPAPSVPAAPAAPGTLPPSSATYTQSPR